MWVTEFIEKCELFCPNCGKQSVWHENRWLGDYYEGITYGCIDCRHTFTMPSGPTLAGTDRELIFGAVLEAL